MNRESFDTYVETQLAPTLQQGDVVILDNLPSHKSARSEAILKQRGARFLFLPPYSPDLNPIEMAFSNSRLISGGSAHEQSTRSGGPSATSAPSTPNRSAGTTSKTPDMPPV